MTESKDVHPAMLLWLEYQDGGDKWSGPKIPKLYYLKAGSLLTQDYDRIKKLLLDVDKEEGFMTVNELYSAYDRPQVESSRNMKWIMHALARAARLDDPGPDIYAKDRKRTDTLFPGVGSIDSYDGNILGLERVDHLKIAKVSANGIFHFAKLNVIYITPEEYERTKIVEVKGESFSADELKYAGGLLDGYTTGKVIGSGTMGKVYDLIKIGKPTDRILKITTRPRPKSLGDTEGYISKIAGDLGIGPKVYGSFWIPLPGDDEGDEPMYNEYIIMQKLSGPTLEDIYPFPPQGVVDAIRLYYNFIRETSIIHNDAKGSNFMYDGKRLYMIDYGIAEISQDVPKWTRAELARHMARNVAGQLVNSMMVKGLDYRAPMTWQNDSPRRRTEIWVSIYNAAEGELDRLFPDVPSKVRGQYYAINDNILDYTYEPLIKILDSQ